MGKQARIARQQREAFRRAHPTETTLVDRAHHALDAAWADLVEGCRQWTQQQRLRAGVLRQVHALKLDVEHIARTRTGYITQGIEWPAWCYYPSALLVVALADGCDWGRSDNAILPMTGVASSLAGISAWHAAPLVARFDHDLAAAVIDTPLTGDIPFDSLRRLPVWGVLLPVPWLRPDALALVWADTGQVRHPDHRFAPGDETTDEMFVMVMTNADDPVVLRLRFSEPTIAASLAAQQDDADRDGPTILGQSDNIDTDVLERFGVTSQHLLSKILALALYLSSDQSDIVDAAVIDDTRRRRRATTQNPTAVVDVGYRIGAALRAHRAQPNDAATPDDAAPTGRTRTPHIRSAHWHTYWFGPRSQPELRHRATRWLPPIGVNIDLDAPAPTTVRDVAPPDRPPNAE